MPVAASRLAIEIDPGNANVQNHAYSAARSAARERRSGARAFSSGLRYCPV
jgi:hypothetical protein